MNKVILMGRLVKNPKLNYGQGADPLAICRYTLAVNRRVKKDGEQGADFINCIAFGKSGEFAVKYFKKGQMVGIVGRLQTQSNEKDCERKWVTNVVVEEQHFAESKKTAAEPQADGNTNVSEGAAPAGFCSTEDMEDDDVPF